MSGQPVEIEQEARIHRYRCRSTKPIPDGLADVVKPCCPVGALSGATSGTCMQTPQDRRSEASVVKPTYIPRQHPPYDLSCLSAPAAAKPGLRIPGLFNPPTYASLVKTFFSYPENRRLLAEVTEADLDMEYESLLRKRYEHDERAFRKWMEEVRPLNSQAC